MVAWSEIWRVPQWNRIGSLQGPGCVHGSRTDCVARRCSGSGSASGGSMRLCPKIRREVVLFIFRIKHTGWGGRRFSIVLVRLGDGGIP